MIKLDLQRFALVSTSKSTELYSSASPSKYPYTLTSKLVENSTNNTNNTSNITITATLKANNQRWSTSYESTLSIYWYDNKTKAETLKASINFAGLETLTSSKTATATFNVEHNTDGSLSGYAKAIFTKGSTTSSNAPPSGSVKTDTVSLTTIPRVSDIAVTNPDVGDTVIITLSRKDASYTDVVTYTIGSITGTASGEVEDTTRTIDTSTMKSQIYQQMGSTNKSIQCSAKVQTFNSNNVSIGTKSKTFTLYAKESECKPTIDFNVVTTDSLSETLTGNTSTIINNVSSTSLSYTATPNYGATIISKSLDGYGSMGNSPITNWNIYSTPAIMTVIDSRNFATILSKNLSIVNYFTPSLNLDAFRTSPTDSEIKVKFQGTFFNDTFGSQTNALTLGWKYRLKGDTNWTNGGTFALNTDYKISGNTFYSGNGTSVEEISLSTSLFPYNNAYDIAITYQDKIVDTFTYKTVSKGYPIMNWDEDMVNVNGDFYLTNDDTNNVKTNITDYITDLISSSDGTIKEIGSNSNGTYIKYNNGLMICHKIVTGTVNISTAWGSGYTTGSQNTISLGNYAAEFKTAPTVTVTLARSGYNCWLASNENPTTTNAGTVSLLRFTTASSVNYRLHVIAIGMWK